MTALFTVLLPAGAQTVPFADVPLLMAEARHGPRESLDEPTLSLFGADWVRDESELAKAFNRGEVVVLDSSAYPMRPPIAANRLAKGVMTVDALRQYLKGVNMALGQADTKPQAAQTLPADRPTAPVVEVPAGKENKRVKTLAYEAEVYRWMTDCYVNRSPGTKPTKGDLHKLVYKKMLLGKIQPQYGEHSENSVREAARPWRKAEVLAAQNLPVQPPENLSSKAPEKARATRHPFKSDR